MPPPSISHGSASMFSPSSQIFYISRAHFWPLVAFELHFAPLQPGAAQPLQPNLGRLTQQSRTIALEMEETGLRRSSLASAAGSQSAVLPSQVTVVEATRCVRAKGRLRSPSAKGKVSDRSPIQNQSSEHPRCGKYSHPSVWHKYEQGISISTTRVLTEKSDKARFGRCI